MKILITGGCGFVGSNIASFLKKNFKKANIWSLDNLSRRGSKINQDRLKKLKIKNFKININDYNKIKILPKFNLIIDCCAEPAIETSKKDPDLVFKTNLVGTFNILKKSVKDKSNLIFLSSSRVYSIKNLRDLVKNENLDKSIRTKKVIGEAFPTSEASSLYGFTKLSSEKLIREFFYQSKQKYLINRFGVIAGPWQFGKQDQGFVPLWVAKNLYKKKLSYIGFGGRGYQIRDVIHIDDVCNIILLQIKKFKKIYNETFNIGGGIQNVISLKNLTDVCEKLTNNFLKIKGIKKTSEYDIPYYVTDNSKIKRAYNWVPKKNINIIVKDIYLWLINNKKLKNYF